MTFPALMPVTVLTQMPSDSTRAEQAPRAAANRAARVAALCRYQAGGADGPSSADGWPWRVSDLTNAALSVPFMPLILWCACPAGPGRSSRRCSPGPGTLEGTWNGISPDRAASALCPTPAAGSPG